MKCSIERSRKVDFRSFGYGMIYFDTNFISQRLTYLLHLFRARKIYFLNSSPIWFFNNTGTGGN